jgi:hypothetical protein
MGDRPRPARAAVARDSRAARRPGLRDCHGPGAIIQGVCQQGRFDGTGVAGRHRRRGHDPRSHLRGPQGSGFGSRPAEDRYRSRLSPARELDPSAAGRDRTAGLFTSDRHLRIAAGEQFSPPHQSPGRSGRGLPVRPRPRFCLSGGDLDRAWRHREDRAGHQSRPLPPPRL